MAADESCQPGPSQSTSKLERTNNGHHHSFTPKKMKLLPTTPAAKINKNLSELSSQLSGHWETGKNYSGQEDGVKITNFPYTHVEISNFIDDSTILTQLVKKFGSDVKFFEKSSDLFKFRQSNDLVSVSVPEIESIRKLFETDVLRFMKDVTGLPLDGKVDMFLSEYLITDFLLCHDDELESRRIAFILYLSDEWDAAYGGSLDLFTSTEEIQPLCIVKSIIPSFNKFVFFNVTSRSFHQVAEVVKEDVRRLALSGWFYGEPLPRPELNFPSPDNYFLHEHISSSNHNPAEYFAHEYLDSANYSAINASLEEFSVAKLKLLLRPEKYASLCHILNSGEETMSWEDRGPANLCSFHTHEILPRKEASTPIQSIIDVFHSAPFYDFLEKVTEFEIMVGNTTRISSPTLRRFQHKSYLLLKSSERNSKVEEEDEEEEWELVADESEEEVEDVDNLQSEEDSSKEDYTAQDPRYTDEDEDVEREVDIIFYCGVFNWKEEFGGQTIYADAHGQQLLTVTPEPNTMAIVVREKTVSSYVSYVNCLAQEESFCTFSFTLTGLKGAN